MHINKKIVIISAVVALVVAAVLFFRYEVYYSHGSSKEITRFTIEKGQGNADISANLKKADLISGKIYFYYYVRTHGLLNKILPGTYELSGNMTIPEIANEITQPQASFVKITFPEGWTSREMAQRLSENGLPGDEFLSVVSDPQNLKKRYSYLTPDYVKTLEGYLFPDTYYFKKDITAENIVGRMLDNFDGKLNSQMRNDVANQNKTIRNVIIMASIIESEVKSQADREMVSGIFWNRIDQSMPLQSDATLTYVLGDNKSQHSYQETRLDSPYNTYTNKGLPPGPISNPGLSAINAAIYPQNNDYMYFLSDPNTGQTLFARTLDEQNQNKVKAGL